MKIERLSHDKIRIFLTFDDLSERGIQKEDMWREIPKVHELFSEMMDQAYNELGFDPTGPLAVEVFALPAQGMVVIVTRGKYDSTSFGAINEEDMDEEVYEMEVTLEQSDSILYAFQDIEHLIELSHMLKDRVTGTGKLYHYKEKWILFLEPGELANSEYHALIALLAEYGEATSVTPEVLDEYGKMIIPAHAIEVICTHFKSHE
ncbi:MULTISPECIES: genetic competence negative regulator [unclassified Paenibacillus]|uniref:genetic competence negative regulator n=1 Tax=unclassified Paenibacillus TaxID=185978 RepID=UPI001C0FE8DF|nr:MULTISPECIES: genetic competence negative regulator [unclassified Paenibacillus]MBU5444111.1 genetic competence negative regulator [Paenibacillus sp. MSJ-34]CAH0118718.1 Adapter protein MecA 2 [Paenibacillus sp. CECT 9249]